MSKTRARILSASRVLFNEKGYSHVTIRAVAMHLNMSAGNLNYHFRKREEILEALYFEMVAVFDERVRQLGSREISLTHVREDIQSSLVRMVEYRFFWTDLYNLLRLNEKIKSHFEKAYKERLAGYQYLFKILIEKGIMRDMEFSKEWHFLANRMIGFSNTWLYNSVLYEEEIDQDYIAMQADSLLFMLYPYLTDFGKSQCRELVPAYFE